MSGLAPLEPVERYLPVVGSTVVWHSGSGVLNLTTYRFAADALWTRGAATFGWGFQIDA